MAYDLVKRVLSCPIHAKEIYDNRIGEIKKELYRSLIIYPDQIFDFSILYFVKPVAKFDRVKFEFLIHYSFAHILKPRLWIQFKNDLNETIYKTLPNRINFKNQKIIQINSLNEFKPYEDGMYDDTNPLNIQEILIGGTIQGKLNSLQFVNINKQYTVLSGAKGNIQFFSDKRDAHKFKKNINETLSNSY